MPRFCTLRSKKSLPCIFAQEAFFIFWEKQFVLQATDLPDPCHLLLASLLHPGWYIFAPACHPASAALGAFLLVDQVCKGFHHLIGAFRIQN
jgi:hypothetical protein